MLTVEVKPMGAAESRKRARDSIKQVLAECKKGLFCSPKLIEEMEFYIREYK